MRNIKLFWVCFGNFIPSSIWLCWYFRYIKIDPYTPKVNLPESVNQVLKDHEETKILNEFPSIYFFPLEVYCLGGFSVFPVPGKKTLINLH